VPAETSTVADVAPESENSAELPPPPPPPDVVYSNADVDVAPPAMVYPHLPRVDFQGPGVNSMEVVVATDGSVQRVRLISVARRMTDMMLLSGAKSWRFEPALRDGRPVRYRMVINWTTQ
jgi:outer membrane biosynthesis protein TonB